MPANTITVHKLLPQLQKDYPSITFVEGEMFVWSPNKQTITYSTVQHDALHDAWALLHEVAHADLRHKHYNNDVGLLMLEVAAWSRAKQIAQDYKVIIDEDHIQDCLDTYRDWLHKRSSCPECTVISLQQKNGDYKCFNCQTQWKVPASPLCRVSRIKIANKKQPA